MSEFLEDPSVLTKDKLKSVLLAHNVALPNGDQRKDVYVQLYLKNLTAQNKKSSGSPDVFSSDEELPPAPVVSNRSRSGRKATRKTDKVRPEDVDVTELSNEGLKDLLLKYGLNAGPIVASTRKVYEKRLQKLLDQGPPEAVAPPSETSQTDGSQNGNTDSDQYSDKEEETVAPAPVFVPEPEPEVEPEPIPVVERPVRSRGKTPVTSRTRSGQHNKVEKVSAIDQTPRTVERDVLKEIFPNENLSTPTGISATCRRPIKGAAGRPLGETWLDESRLRHTEFRETSSSSYKETRSVPRVAAVPLAASKPVAPPAVKTRARRSLPVWVQLLLLSAVAGFLFFVYQAMETNEVGLFKQSGADDSTSK
ncbi:thymopoietin a isoform X8 [Ctenopharyngodon idella]|uniref:thymopoietin a isoform X8 n=1 Tax=Ctenopharyngodon idella TaxID=7959 RepID=UPI00222E42BD|nr:thymopoietin a isoform X8 [Ctenopharyngodon idella]